VQRYCWQLLAVESLIDQVASQATTSAHNVLTDREWARLCEQVVSVALFDACVRGGLATASLDEQRCQELAYGDLRAYLITKLRYLGLGTGIDGEDLVQETLLIIKQSHRACREPAAFLAWAVMILRRQGQATWPTRPLPRSLNHEPAEHGHADARRTVDSRADRSVDPQGDQDLLRLLHNCLETEEERFVAVCMMLGLKRRELSWVFDAPLTHLDYVSQCVKRKLRASAEFRALFRAPQFRPQSSE